MKIVRDIFYEGLIIILIFTIFALSGFFISSKISHYTNDFHIKQNLEIHPDSLSDLIKVLKPAVVNISTTEEIKGHSFLGNDFLYKFFGDIPKKDSIKKSLGSGFILNENGYIITNNHVIENAENIKVKLYNNKEFDAKIIGRDKKTDIALIKIKSGGNFPYVVLGNSESIEVGEWVIAIGNPFGLEHTVTIGIVSGKDRVIGTGPYDDFIQTDASINPGNSGGPLFNIKGEVVGINTAIISGGRGIGFAIPINIAKNLIFQLKEKGKVVRGYLGVKIQEITPELAESFELEKPEGALVSEVIKGGPAYKAGIVRGDIILEYDGREINNFRDLPKMVALTEVGKKVKIRVIRDKKELNFVVKVGKLKEEMSP
jgi:serine protease Do